MNARTISVTAAIAVLLLAGCTPTPPTTPSTPSEPGGTTGSEVEADCLVGTWDLDVANYREQSEAYLTELAIPLQDFRMEGSQTLIFTASGIVELDTDVTSGGTIVVEGFVGPISATATSVHTGDWSRDGDALGLEHWAVVSETSSTTDGAPEGITGVDFADVPSITVLCDETSLFLQAPGAPLGSYWTRR